MKKGQAAIEFVTTYGWALLIVLVMVGAIAYFGVVDPSRIIPDRCQVSGEISCKDYALEANGNGKIRLQLHQNVGKTIYVRNITCKYGPDGDTAYFVDDVGTVYDNTGTVKSWSPRNNLILACDIPPTAPSFISMRGSKAKAYFEVNYQLSNTGTAINHPASGEIYAKVQ